MAAFRERTELKARERRTGRWESGCLAFVAVNAFLLSFGEPPRRVGAGDASKKGGKVARHPRETTT